MISLFLAITAGILAGIITGLIPGIHVNLISLLLISSTPFLSKYFPMHSLALFIISMSITHTFVDIIPSIFLGAPNEDTALAVLPGHLLLLDGKGYEAVRLATIGSLLSLVFGICIFPIILFIVPKIYSFLKPYIAYLLIFVVLFLFYVDEKRNRAVIIFTLSGFVGYIVLQFPNLHQPLFPLLSGIFGVSLLITSLFEQASPPPQYITEHISLKNSRTAKSVLAASFSGWITSMFPGIGAAHAAIIAKTFFPRIDSLTYIVVIGGINTVNFIFSLATFFTLQKARNGAVIAVQQLISTISWDFLLVVISSILVIGGCSALLTLFLAKLASNLINKVNYPLLCICVIALIFVLTVFLSGFIGLLILLISTALGIFTHLLSVKKSHAMGCLLLPVIIYLI